MASETLLTAVETAVWMGMRAGSKESVPIGRMLDHGFAIASVEYRLSKRAPFPAQIHDVGVSQLSFRICLMSRWESCPS